MPCELRTHEIIPLLRISFYFHASHDTRPRLILFSYMTDDTKYGVLRYIFICSFHVFFAGGAVSFNSCVFFFFWPFHFHFFVVFPCYTGIVFVRYFLLLWTSPLPLATGFPWRLARV